MTIRSIALIASVLALFALSTPGQKISKSESNHGVLLLAHGGKQNWNDEVLKIATGVDNDVPTEVAFGMASRSNIQQAVDKLTARGVKKIIAVPLFISSHSSVITSTEYLLGQRESAPPELAVFAKMSHGSHDGGHGSAHGIHNSTDGTTPVKTSVPINVSPALNAHPLVGEILLSRAADKSRKPENEVVVIVAHGPVADAENARWLSDMRVLSDIVRAKSNFKRIEYLTVRDDAPEPIRSKATAELRAVVQRALDEKSNVLIVPLLLAYGGIEEGIKKRLEGLDYVMSNQALLPDHRLVEWIREMVRNSKNNK